MYFIEQNGKCNNITQQEKINNATCRQVAGKNKPQLISVVIENMESIKFSTKNFNTIIEIKNEFTRN